MRELRPACISSVYGKIYMLKAGDRALKGHLKKISCYADLPAKKVSLKQKQPPFRELLLFGY